MDKSLLEALQADTLANASAADAAEIKAAFDEAALNSASRESEYEELMDEEDRPAKVRCGIFFRRTPAEVQKGNLCIPGTETRTGIMLAYCGDDDGSDPNRWCGTVLQYYGAWYDEKRKTWVNPAIRAIQAFRVECEKCGGVLLSARDIRKAASAYADPGKKETVVENLVGLGDVCPKCGGHHMTAWRQIDPLGEDGEVIYGSKVMEWVKDRILSATGELDIPPVVGYVSNGVPGSMSRLPATTIAPIMDRLCEVAGKRGLQVVGYDDLNPADDIAGVDFVCPDICVGLEDPVLLGNGIRTPKGTPYEVDIKLHTRAALAGRRYDLPTSDDPWPGRNKAPNRQRGKGHGRGGHGFGAHF